MSPCDLTAIERRIDETLGAPRSWDRAVAATRLSRDDAPALVAEVRHLRALLLAAEAQR